MSLLDVSETLTLDASVSRCLGLRGFVIPVYKGSRTLIRVCIAVYRGLKRFCVYCRQRNHVHQSSVELHGFMLSHRMLVCFESPDPGKKVSSEEYS